MKSLQNTAKNFLKEEKMKANKEERLDKNILPLMEIQGKFYPQYVVGYEYLYRWLRRSTLDLRKKNKGLSVVRHTKGKYRNFPKIKKGKLKGCIGVGGLILCKIKITVKRKI